MDKRWFRFSGWLLAWIVGCALWWWSGQPNATAQGGQWTIPDQPPLLVNGSFECTNGFIKTQNAAGKDIWIPNGWTPVFVVGSPRLLSTRLSETDLCHPNSGGHVTRQEGIDSWYIPSQDIATPPIPGKPFDIILYQRVPALYGGEYSLSAWLTSECGTNSERCSGQQYIAKTIGIDPLGGTDHNATSIQWVEANRADRHWQNMYMGIRALTNYITIYARITSPYQKANNKGFVDAFSLVRAPLASLNPLSPTVEASGVITVSWHGQQSADIAAIPGGNYDLLFDVQVRTLPSETWQNFVVGVREHLRATFEAPCLNRSYEFRVRARAEQPEGEPGASPNHRYSGAWSQPQAVFFSAPATPPINITPPISETVLLTPSLGLSQTLYLPMTANSSSGFRGCS